MEQTLRMQVPIWKVLQYIADNHIFNVTYLFLFYFPPVFCIQIFKISLMFMQAQAKEMQELRSQLKSTEINELTWTKSSFWGDFCICKLWEPQKDNALIYFGRHTDTGAPHMHRIKWIGVSIFGVNLLFHIIRSYKIIGYKEMKVLNYRMIPHSHFLIFFSSLNFLDESLLIVWL